MLVQGNRGFNEKVKLYLPVYLQVKLYLISAQDQTPLVAQ